MTSFLKALWNLPATVLKLAASRLGGAASSEPVLHRGCGGRWRLQKRDGKPFERCVRCGEERGAPR
jgi:hypothetical protein